MKLKLPALIGVLPLTPLGGTPAASDRHPADALRAAGLRAVTEAKALARAGFGGILLENFGDAPFNYGSARPETIAAFAVVAAAVRESVRVSLGIRVLGNDPLAALAIAAVVDADFIRVDGIEHHADALLRERDRLGVTVAILAPVSSIPLGIDGEIFAALPDRPARGKGPRWLEGNAAAEEVSYARSLGYGVILGGALRKGESARRPLDSARVKALVAAYRKGNR